MTTLKEQTQTVLDKIALEIGFPIKDYKKLSILSREELDLIIKMVTRYTQLEREVMVRNALHKSRGEI